MNYKGKTKILGFNIPNMLFIAIGLFIVLLFFGLYKFLRSVFTKVKTFFGNFFGTTGTEAKEENLAEITKSLTKDEGVKSQMTQGNRLKTESIFKCMDGPGTNTKELISLIKSISGPNQQKAIFLIYGTRTLSFFPFITNWIPALGAANLGMNFTGNLIECVKEELSKSDYKIVEPYLNRVTQ